MTSGSADFHETSAVVGDTVHAEFHWNDAVWNNVGEFYCDMSIKDPNGDNCSYYAEEETSSATNFLSCVTDMSGTWTAQISIWDGNDWITYTDTIQVSIQGAPGCSANFQNNSAEVGDTLYADFTWADATRDGYHAYMVITDPDGQTKASWLEILLSDGSKTLNCVADKEGVWVAEITAYNDFSSVTCTDTLNVTSGGGSANLGKAITCKYFEDCDYDVPGSCGCGDEGPRDTDFTIDEIVIAYFRLDSSGGYDFYGDTMSREWWYRAAGETEYTLRATSDSTCTNHYTGYWCGWTWWDLGNEYGEGDGFVRVYLNGTYMGKASDFDITGDVIGHIQPSSVYYEGPFQTSVENTGVTAPFMDDFIYLHHLFGTDWLTNGLIDELNTKGYIDEINDIFWETDIEPDIDRPDSLAPTPGAKMNMNHWVFWFNDYLGGIKYFDSEDGVNRIIMFNSNYAASLITSDGTQPGDPFSPEKTIANYKALFHKYSTCDYYTSQTSCEGAGCYWYNDACHSTSDETYDIYTNNDYDYYALEDIFALNPNTLFIINTAPPYGTDGTDDAEAHRARMFNNWLKNDWLMSYNKKYPDNHNVLVWDWFDLLANPDDAPIYPNRLKTEYSHIVGTPLVNALGYTDSTTSFSIELDTAFRRYAEMNTLIADLIVKNIGSSTGCLNIEVVSNPGTSDESILFYGLTKDIPAQTEEQLSLYAYIPDIAIDIPVSLPVGVKVWGMNETEPFF